MTFNNPLTFPAQPLPETDQARLERMGYFMCPAYLWRALEKQPGMQGSYVVFDPQKGKVVACGRGGTAQHRQKFWQNGCEHWECYRGMWRPCRG